VKSFFDQSKLDVEIRIDSRTRAGRVFRAVYRDRVSRFDAMTTIPLTSRKTLADGFDLDLPSIAGRFDSKDGTQRYLLRLRDGETAESVLIPNSDRVTFCVSSQIGCALGCTFCLTGQMGLVRDLSAGEIVSQVVVLQREAMHNRFSIVLMGMGEPLQNYDNVVKAMNILHDDHGLGVAPARITLSTAGLVPGIERLAQEQVFPNLSISLTGATNAVRDVLMPINRKYSIETVMEAVRKLPRARQSRVMFEYVMIKDVTDSPYDALELSRRLRGMCAKVNLIPLNPAPEIPYKRAEERDILRFQEILVRNGTTTFVRRNRGNDVSGACGQLKNRIRVRPQTTKS
jgi:23S rRNA (adenine2503-C2)-methyltransferase